MNNDTYSLQKVVFTDIDGTLIDIFTREYGNSAALVRKLQEQRIPVILCSSKTMAEQDKIRKELGMNRGENESPFIIENGGAVVVPKNQFLLLRESKQHRQFSNDDDSDDDNNNNRHVVFKLGRERKEIRSILNEIRTAMGIQFKGVGDLSVDELSEIVKMPYEDAARMAQREYSETIVQIDKDLMPAFAEAITNKGLRIIHGGRFFDVTSGYDKGVAVEMLKDLYQKKKNVGGNDRDKNILFFGVGDSRNDIPMLMHVDVPILVQSHDGSWNTDVVEQIPNVVKVSGIGPKGWESAFEVIIMRS